MAKADMEKKILDMVAEEVKYCDEMDEEIRNLVNPSQTDVFFRNHHLFVQELRDIISRAMFDKPEITHHDSKKAHGWWNEVTVSADQQKMISAVIEGMIKKGHVRYTKSRKMVKVLF